MTDRFDDAKRALEGVPARDVWAEAERRASDSAVVPLTPVAEAHGRHRGRWLAAVAAVTLLAVGTVAALAADDDAPVDTVPGSANPEEVTIYEAADGACKLGIVGEPLPEPATVSAIEPPYVGDTRYGTLVEGSLNASQTYSIQVPGQVVIDLIGERTEEVQLHRGTATVWFQPDAVQVRWFSGGDAVCDTVTVTVGGGTEDENRHAAVDLAERVLMSDELPDSLEPTPNPSTTTLPTTTTLPITTTSLVDSIQDEVAGVWEIVELRDGDTEVAVPAGEVLVELLATEVSWTDGCTGHRRIVEYGVDALILGELAADSEVECPDDPGRSFISQLFGASTIEVVVDGGRLELRAGDQMMLLEPF